MAEHFRYDFQFGDLGIDTDQIGRLLDYDMDKNKEMVTSMIEDALTEAESLCEIRSEFAIWEGVAFDRDTSSIFLEGLRFDVGKIVAHQLRRSESIAVFACTAGRRIGEAARKMIREKDFLKGYIVDLVGSRAADGTADLMQERLEMLIENRGLKITNRYSPGYCGWDVSEQHKLFTLIPDNYCGITLNSSALMDPIKSVSGIIGIGHNVRFNQYTCNLCDQENCIYRNYRSRNEK